eukprot:1612688-Amphidinium_carterae.1
MPGGGLWRSLSKRLCRMLSQGLSNVACCSRGVTRRDAASRVGQPNFLANREVATRWSRCDRQNSGQETQVEIEKGEHYSY